MTTRKQLDQSVADTNRQLSEGQLTGNETCLQAFDKFILAGEQAGHEYAGAEKIALWNAFKLGWYARGERDR